MAFFQYFWNDVQEDILAFMNEFFLRGKLSKSLGASFIALVPKKSGADIISDFRPIGLIGSTYKILAIMLAGRLLKNFPSVLSPSQDVSVHGRQILDDVLIANECVHSRLKEVSQVCFCKLDMEKACDRVDWVFFLYVLRIMGFGEKWRGWIM